MISTTIKHKNISRVVTGKTNGWQVRINRLGTQHSKFFSLAKFGNTEESALQAALQYRDSFLSLAPRPSRGAAEVNKSRNAGIRRVLDGSVPRWRAAWVDENGRRCTRSFSVREHGELRAQQMARKARMAGIARIDIDVD